MNRRLPYFEMPSKRDWVSATLWVSLMIWNPSYIRKNLISFLILFSNDEISAMLKALPSNHAPGPDGFNGFFIKKCWSIIKDDLLRVIHDFHGNVIDISCLNSSHIALIPKKPNPATVDDYRPISLLNYSLKCITKLLSTRLQSVITRLVHPNQYDFIRERTIQTV